MGVLNPHAQDKERLRRRRFLRAWLAPFIANYKPIMLADIMEMKRRAEMSNDHKD